MYLKICELEFKGYLDLKVLVDILSFLACVIKLYSYRI